jgi:hypothetical protein
VIWWSGGANAGASTAPLAMRLREASLRMTLYSMVESFIACFELYCMV